MIKDLITSAGIYGFGLLIIIPRVLDTVISSDMALEYEIYQKGLFYLKWVYVHDSLVNSSLFTTILPAYVQHILNLSDNTIVFKIWPCLFFAGMPVVTYLIAKRYLSWPYAVLAAGYIMTHFYFIKYPAMGRVAVGWFFTALLLYGLLNNKVSLIAGSGVALVFAHYGSALMAAGILATVGCWSLWKKENRFVYIASLVLLLFVGYDWHFIQSRTLGHYIVGILNGGNYGDASNRGVVTNAMLSVLPWVEAPMNVNPVLLYASWASIFIILIGVLVHIRDRVLLSVISGGYLVALVLAFLIPSFSYIYGLSRVLYTGLPVLAVGLMSGFQWINAKTGIPALLLATPFVILHPILSPF